MDYQIGHGRSTIRNDHDVSFPVINEIIRIRTVDQGSELLNALALAQITFPSLSATQGVSSLYFLSIKDVEGGRAWAKGHLDLKEALAALELLANATFPTQD